MASNTVDGSTVVIVCIPTKYLRLSLTISLYTLVIIECWGTGVVVCSDALGDEMIGGTWFVTKGDKFGDWVIYGVMSKSTSCVLREVVGLVRIVDVVEG